MKKALGVILVLIVVGAIAVYLSLDALLKRGIEEATTYATGTPTSVGTVDLGLFSGRLDLGNLEIHNPKGYDTDYFFQLKNFDIAVHPRSLLNSTVRIPTLIVDGATLNLERKGTGTNFNQILQHVRQVSGTGKGKEQAPSKQGGAEKRFIIGKLRITDISANVKLAAQLKKAQATLPPVELNDVGAKSGGVTLTQLAELIVQELLKRVQTSDLLPGDLQQQLKGSLEDLRNLEGNLRQQTEQETKQRLQKELEKQKQKLLDQGSELLKQK